MSNRLFIHNLSPETTEAELYGLFASVGHVDVIVFLTDQRTGQSQGYCIVDMASADQARAAIRKLNGSLLHGEIVQVIATRPPNLRSSHF
jgi:RNA recognition motif-containing protein